MPAMAITSSAGCAMAYTAILNRASSRLSLSRGEGNAHRLNAWTGPFWSLIALWLLTCLQLPARSRGLMDASDGS